MTGFRLEAGGNRGFMASITSSGIGSGLDVVGLVQQLVAAEGQPAQNRFAQQEARAQSKLSAYGSLKSSMSAFRDQLEKMESLDDLRPKSATSADPDKISVSVDSAAAPARHSVEVVQLAQAQKLESAAFASSDTVIGTGTLTLAVGAAQFDIEIDDQNNTLAGIRDAINNASDNTGISATIVNADDGSHLILSAAQTGSDQAMTITQTGGDGGLSAIEYDVANGLTSLSETAQALDAHVRIDGFDVTSDNNSITGAIEGVTLDLKADSAGTTTVVTVENNLNAMREQLNAFVDSYNGLLDTFERLTKYDTETETAAALIGDSAIRGVRNQLRREMSVAVSDIAASGMLYDIGIETEVSGRLSIDETVMNEYLNKEFTNVGQYFASSDGYVSRLTGIIDNYLDEDEGILTARIEGIDKRIEDIGDRRIALGERLTSLEARLLKQFNALDALVGELSTTSNFLTQQLASLPTISVTNK